MKAVLLSTADITAAAQRPDAAAVVAAADHTTTSSSSSGASSSSTSGTSDAFSLAARMKLAKTLVQDTFVSAKVSAVCV